MLSLLLLYACGCPDNFMWTCVRMDSGVSSTHASECTSQCESEGQEVEWCGGDDGCHEYTCEKDTVSCH